MGGVFINYRGEDSQTAAALIDRELTGRFGRESVFLDSRSIPVGVDFAEELLGRLQTCSVVLVVIGPRWLTLTDAAGRRRIDDQRDWIRREMVAAFRLGLRVIPVLLDGGVLPGETELPADIAALSRRQYVPLRRRYTRIDLDYLVERIVDVDPELAATYRKDHMSAGRRLVTLVLVFLVLVLPPFAINLAPSAVPERVSPYLWWLAWPVLALTVVLVKARRPRGASTHHGAIRTSNDDLQRLSHAAEQLAEAVHRQWSDEAAIRMLNRPQPMYLRWSSTGRPVAAHPAAVLGDGVVGGRPLRLRLRGRLDEVVDAFTRLPRRQLVVLGEPGAGKTVLAILLALGLLDYRRDHGGPVPVLLSPSSWDPHTEHLHTWVAGRLVDDYPALANNHAFGSEAAARLVTSGRILPILDGLDEMPISLRAAAIEAINRARAGKPMVVTCRSAEYQAAVAAGGNVLATAAVVELEPVSVDDVIAFLSTGGVDGDTRWAPVFAHLRAHPDGYLATALSSPLMVALARIVYTGPAAEPAELLHPDQFISPKAIEEHLLEAFIPAAYAHHPPPPALNQQAKTTPRYRPELARTYLTFLARDLHQRCTHDMAWWQLHRALTPWRRALSGVVLTLLSGLVTGTGIGIGPGLTVGIAGGLACGLGLGLVIRPPSHPRRISPHGRRGLAQLRRKLLAGLVVGLATGAVCGLGLGVGLAAGLTGGLVNGLAIGIMEFLNTPADEISSPSPMSVLRNDRTLSAIRISLGGLSIGLVVGLFVGRGVGVPAALAVGFMSGVVIGLASRLVGVRGAGPEHSAWAWFLISRSWLALKGQLPWRLMRFLDDAHRRGVLRQAGAVYQFRHARLQDRLAGTPQPKQLP